MNPNVVAAAILGVAIVVASFMVSGRYAISRHQGSSTTYILDRFTGELRRCTFEECAIITTRPK